MLDLVLAYAHHLAVFTVVGLVFAEMVVLRPGITGKRIVQLAGLDSAYGGFATLVLIAGFSRVIWGDAGMGFYFPNPVFWTKIGLFVAVGVLSISPTLAIARWRRAAKADEAYQPPEAEVRRARRFLHVEMMLLALIPLAAAAMARGYGL
jgi:putative membrane protein